MFSDFFEVPSEWKTALKAELERDPPILGKATLGGLQASVPLETLAGSGMIGGSGVSIAPFEIRLGTESDYVNWVKFTTGQIWTKSNWVLIGPAHEVMIGYVSGIWCDIRKDGIRFGNNGDVGISRQSAEQIETGQRLGLTKNVGASETPLVVNNGGSMWGVKVGPNDSAAPGARVLYLDNV